MVIGATVPRGGSKIRLRLVARASAFGHPCRCRHGIGPDGCYVLAREAPPHPPDPRTQARMSTLCPKLPTHRG